jgi:hypothetical protein
MRGLVGFHRYMRFPVHLALATLASLALALPAAATAATTPPAPVTLSAALTTCKPARDTSGGTAVFTGSMPQIDGATRMEMRFVLLQSTDGASATKVALPKWGGWQRSEPGRSGFVFRKKVVGLVGPASYRAQIQFRWLDDAGKVVRVTKKATPACQQPDVRPNLTPLGVTATAADDDLATYRVTVRNTGRVSAGPFAVTLSVAGATPLQEQVDVIRRGAKVVVVLSGPACTPGSTLDIAVDPENLVAESDESDNALSVPCPL